MSAILSNLFTGWKPVPQRHFCGMGILPMILLMAAAVRADAPILYSQNFDALNEGNPPEEILILNGAFTIKKIDNNGVMELAADPVDTCGFLAGPADQSAYTVSARIQAASTGKRTPEFGIGANGTGQWKLWMMPAVGELQLIKGDEVKASVKYDWQSGSWTRMKLAVRKEGEKFKVEGKAWADGKDEPKEWMLSQEDTEALPPGRAVFWSVPYSSKGTRFDDVVIQK
jgi:hypothetical protein